MAGLELILDTIISDAKKISEEKINIANNQAEAIKKEYAEEIDKVSKEEQAKRTEQINILKERAGNEKMAYFREMLLREEREAAKEIISLAKKRILDMPKEEYFDLLCEVYKNQNDLIGGEILLCKEDKENMPEGFLEKLNKNLVLSDDEIKQKGFIIREGKVELNCTIDALFHEKESELYDVACKKE